MKTLLKLITFIILFQVLLTAQEKKEFSVAIIKDLVPYSFVNKDGKPDGIFTDYWKLWAKKQNVNINFKVYSWSESLEAIKNKEVDIHSGLFQNKQREEYISYLDKIYPSQGYIYIKRDKKEVIKSIEDLNNQEISVLKSSYFEGYLKENNPLIKLNINKSLEQRFIDIKNSKVDYFIDDALVTWFQLVSSLEHKNFITLENFKINKWFYSGIRKGDQTLKEFVESGIKKISYDELVELEKKWIIQDEYRYFEQKKQIDLLTFEERLWLLRNQDIKFAVVKDWENYSILNKFGEVEGLHIDLLDIINKKLRTDFKYKAYDSWTSAYNSVKEDKTEAIFGLSWSKSREEIFSFSPSYHYSPYYIVIHKDEDSIRTLADFKDKKVVTLENSITNEIIKEEVSSVNIVNAQSVEDILQKLSNKKVKAAILENAKDLNLKKYDLKIVAPVYSKYGKLHIGVNKRYRILNAILEKALNSISTTQLQTLKDKWLKNVVEFSKKEQEYIRNTDVLKVGVENWTAISEFKNEYEMQGIGAKIVQKALDVSGLRYELVKGEWSNLLESFKKGEIDILPTSFYTDDRATFGEFSDGYIWVKNFLYVRYDNSEVKSFEDLKGKKLAIQKGYATIDLVKQKFPEIQIVETKNLEESITLVLNGTVDALFELQISVESKLKEFLVTNLKPISQNSIKAQELHILSIYEDYTLVNILNKSLASISQDIKNEIISKWTKSFEIKKDVKVAFGKGREPYVINKGQVQGIEYDLIREILSLSDISISESKNLSVEELNKAMSKDDEFDIAVNRKLKEDDNLFYSDLFLSFENIVVSKKSRFKAIRSLEELKDKKVFAFHTAHKFLGSNYNKILQPSTNKNYKETSNQQEQVEALLNDKADFIILDKNIFSWYINKLDKAPEEKYNIDYVFHKKNPRYVAFKNKVLRDIFNKNLEIVKSNGTYDSIFLDYSNGLIKAKVKINSLIADIASNFIFVEELDGLTKVMNIFSTLPYIEKIEVFDNSSKLLYKSNNKPLVKHRVQNSYYYIVNVPQKVGFIKVYFDDNLLKEYEKKDEFIPKISLFENLKTIEYIKSIYKKYNYLDKGLNLTKEEKDFIKEKKTIYFSEIDWRPITLIEDNKFSGLTKDYLEIIEKNTGLNIEFKKYKDWDEVVEAFEKREIDIIPALGDIAFSIKNSFVTNSMADFKYAIVTNKEGRFLDGLKDLKGKKVALPKNFSSYALIKDRYPNVKIIETKSIDESLSLVSKGEADAFVGHSAVVVYKLQNSFPDLKVSGLSEERFSHYILVQDKYPQLLSILNKSIFHITPNQKYEIKNKWIKSDIKTEIDYELLYKVIAGFSIILIIVLIFTKKLSNTKKELLEKSKDLEEQRNVFRTLFNDSSDGLSLIKAGRFVECNDAVLRMLNYKTKDEFLNLKPHELSPQFQPDGMKSEDKAVLLIEECIQKGNIRFEWVHKKSNGQNFWVEVLLTKLILNHEEVIHVVWRDIEDKKLLEEQNLKRTMELEDTNIELELSIENLKRTQTQLIESEKMASLGGLVAGVAHEINTPIGVAYTGSTHFKEITLNLKKLYEEEKMSEESFEEYLNTSIELSTLINTNIKRAANLVKSFKQVAVDQTSEERRVFNMQKYLEEILSSIHSVTKKTNLDFKIVCENNLEINSYPGAISQIVTNLIMNSIIHGYEPKQKGLVSIEVNKEEDSIKLIYKDDGKGIPSENLPKIFDPFFTTNREKGGSGLGLNIIYNIVTSKLNGKINCQNNKNGVEFIIVFKV
ncbi:transporter substrate-binding domain-containing protein [Arcobacter sp. YIC-464]|uniref:transporter substrate-binding domain-containing protein n=1 Tax=Arcobacter sp. YIC-464 TaxID=3376631 RepID=UPI003C263810